MLPYGHIACVGARLTVYTVCVIVYSIYIHACLGAWEATYVPIYAPSWTLYALYGLIPNSTKPYILYYTYTSLVNPLYVMCNTGSELHNEKSGITSRLFSFTLISRCPVTISPVFC